MERLINNRIILPVLLFSLFFLPACQELESYNDVISTDMTKPGVVSNVKVENFPGGAYITYSLPESDNLLYVLADYKINAEIGRQKKASYYTDTIRVDGFAKSQDYEVTLYAVSRADVKSDPVKVKVHPETPPYLTIFPSISVKPDFGGVQVSAENIYSQPIGVVVITPNENGEWEPAEQFYSDDTSLVFSVRGYDTLAREFGVYVTDPWNNYSDTLYTTLEPFYETLFDKSKFSEFRLPSDASMGYGWVMPRLWDNNTGSGYHTEVGTGMPQTLTFDMGGAGQISRFRTWHRSGTQYSFAHGNPKRWALWGSNNPTDDALPADVADLSPGDEVGNWVFMGYFEAPAKPSGLPSGSNTAEDVAFNNQGFEYPVSLDVPPVRYIRFQTLESFSGGDFMHFMEISIWGTPQ